MFLISNNRLNRNDRTLCIYDLSILRYIQKTTKVFIKFYKKSMLMKSSVKPSIRFRFVSERYVGLLV